MLFLVFAMAHHSRLILGYQGGFKFIGYTLYLISKVLSMCGFLTLLLNLFACANKRFYFFKTILFCDLIHGFVCFLACFWRYAAAMCACYLDFTVVLLFGFCAF